MDITDVYECANFYKDWFVNKFYIVTTYSGSGFIVVAEEGNFPHLIGINHSKLWSNGYRKAKILYKDLVNRAPINPNIISATIPTRSKIYKKLLNFASMNKILIKNKLPIIINFDRTICPDRFETIQHFLWDATTGYMIGLSPSKEVPISSNIKIKSYCLSTWMDNSIKANKEFTHTLGQDIDLVRHVYVFDGQSQLLEHKKYNYSRTEKVKVMKMCEKNGNNLILDHSNLHNYISIAKTDSIHCLLNGNYYDG